MVFHRRMQAPINSIKHYVGQPKFDVALGTSTTLEIVDVVAAPVSPDREKVKEGSVIKAIFFEFWMVTNGGVGTSSQFVMTIEKSPSGVIDPAFSDMLNLGGYKNKKNILYSSQGILSSDSVAQAVPLIRDWLKIPKGKQRFGSSDRMLITFASVDSAMSVCGISTYKEYV